MKHARILSIMILLVASMAILTVPAAACIPSPSGNADDITCNAVNPIVNNISGLGGGDTITVLNNGGDKSDNVFGDNSSFMASDVITISNSPLQWIFGDFDNSGTFSGSETGGNDTITLNNGADVDIVYGDFIFQGAGNADPIGGNDNIFVNAGAEVDEDVFGDFVGNNDGANGGGDDIISINGLVRGDVNGDRVRALGDPDADGGNDAITINGTVVGDVLGDDVGDDGGDDTVVVNGSVGGNLYGDYLYGEDNCCQNLGGDDSLVVSNGGKVGQVYGDYEASPFSFLGAGGNDTITIAGTAIAVGGDHIEGSGGDDSITISGSVQTSVYGDFITGTAGPGNGGDDYIKILGTVGSVVHGDQARGNGGDDTIIVDNNSRVSGDVRGDFVDGLGGDDSIVIYGFMNGARTISGDYSDGNGGDDTIYLKDNSSFNLTGSVYGDNIQTDTGAGGDDYIEVANGSTFIDGSIYGDGIKGVTVLGGRDTIVVSGTVTGTVSGDDNNFEARSRRDTITINSSASVGTVSGDLTKKAGSRDVITISGTVEKSVFGDNVNRAGGSDLITVTSSGLVKKNVVGDLAKTIQGGDDTINIAGTVNKNVFGDNFRSSAKPDADGGDDSITILSGGLVKGDVIGDSAPDAGGDDYIRVAGTVNGDVIGDQVTGQGGVDTIEVSNGGRVKGDVIGDDAGIPANVANNGQDDVFIINGIVDGTVYLDNVGGPTFPDITGNASGIDLAAGGNDIVIVAGQIGGNILSSPGSDGDDIFIIQNNATVGGMMDAGGHIDGDSLVFDLSTKSKGEFRNLASLFDGLTVDNGSVTYRGNSYHWVNFEILETFIQLLETRTVPLVCSGIYEKNAEGTACVQKGQQEQEAIMFHRNNPGYDGRMPGTEACAIYNYGNAMRVYEVVDGSEGELVTTISADVFSHNIESNLHLASSASGNVNVYYLTSREVQVECTDWTGKTQVRIIPDFSGTVNASFDKAGQG